MVEDKIDACETIWQFPASSEADGARMDVVGAL